MAWVGLKREYTFNPLPGPWNVDADAEHHALPLFLGRPKQDVWFEILTGELKSFCSGSHVSHVNDIDACLLIPG